MKLRNTTDQNIDLPTLGLSVEAGKTVEVAGQAAHALLAQGDTWKRADKPKPRSTGAKTTKATTTAATTAGDTSADKGD